MNVSYQPFDSFLVRVSAAITEPDRMIVVVMVVVIIITMIE